MKNIPYWLDIPYTPRPALQSDAHADVVVVGAGITGVSVAYHCTKAGLKTILIEKDTIAYGSGGRNGGMVVEGMESDFYAAVEKFGQDRAKALWNSTVRARQLVQSLIQENNIECDLEQLGSIYISRSEEESLKLHKEAQARQQAGLVFEKLSREQLPSKSPFVEAIFNPSDMLIQPAKYVRGLAAAAEKQGLIIYEHTRAVSFDGQSVTTEMGTIHAGKVVLAIESSNEHMPEGTELFRSQAIVTEPLTEQALTAMDWVKGGMVWPTDDDYVSIRKIGNRLFSCKNTSLEPTEAELEENRRWQINKLISFFPTLTEADLTISHCWTGLMVSVPSYGSCIRNNNGVYEIFGHAGLGLTNGTMTGKVLTDHLMGGEVPDIYRM